VYRSARSHRPPPALPAFPTRRSSDLGAERGLFKNTKNGDEVYFVHSFQALPRRREDCAATVEYGGRTVCAAVRRGNVTGFQFHRSEEHTSELQSRFDLVCRLLLEK